jgi:predicted RNA-binding protein
MCLSKAYLDTNGQRELLMEEIASIRFEKDRLVVTTLLGEQKEIRAGVREIDFLQSRIILENLEPEGTK